MRLLLLGATGNCGSALLSASLRAGHEVTALVRSESKLRGQLGENPAPGLVVKEADAFDQDALARAVENQDAVINAALSAADGDRFVEACDLLVGAAELGLRSPGRLWAFGGAAVLSIPGTPRLGVDLPGVPRIYRLHARNLERLRRSTLDWSLMCPGPMIHADPNVPLRTDLRVSAEVIPFDVPPWVPRVPAVALSLVFARRLAETIVSYEDVAHLIVQNLAPGGPFSRKRVGIALPAGERGRKAGW